MNVTPGTNKFIIRNVTLVLPVHTLLVYSVEKMVNDPGACSKMAQKKIIKKQKKVMAIILSLVILE